MHKSNNFAFIDGANLHLTYENMDWQLDYEKLLNYPRKRLDVSIAYYFIGKTKDTEDICTTLESYGYTIKLKNPSPHVIEEEYCPHCGKLITPKITRYKSDVDSFLTLQVISDLHLYDKAVLITSDGDYDNLVKKLVAQDKLRAVFAPCKDGCSWLLKSAARGRIAFIDDYKGELEKV